MLPETRQIPDDASWRVAPAPADLTNRRVEITGPTHRKMLVNAMNSSAKCGWPTSRTPTPRPWPTWSAGRPTSPTPSAGGSTSPPRRANAHPRDAVATIVTRPRGWHLDERHLEVDKAPLAGVFMDFGLYFYHNAARQLAAGSGPYFYLPEMESHLGVRPGRTRDPAGTIRATMLIETIPAASQIEEILDELRDHASGLNAGRWDYMSSLIKTFRGHREFVLPDRNSVTMTVPFLGAYTELLVQTCHRRGAVAIGGMAAFIPTGATRRSTPPRWRMSARTRSARPATASTVAGWRTPTWCRGDGGLRPRPRRPAPLGRQCDDVQVRAEQLLDVWSAPGEITKGGGRHCDNIECFTVRRWRPGSPAAVGKGGSGRAAFRTNRGTGVTGASVHARPATITPCTNGLE